MSVHVISLVLKYRASLAMVNRWTPYVYFSHGARQQPPHAVYHPTSHPGIPVTHSQASYQGDCCSVAVVREEGIFKKCSLYVQAVWWDERQVNPLMHCQGRKKLIFKITTGS